MSIVKEEKWSKQKSEILKKKTISYEECSDFLKEAKVSEYFSKSKQKNTFDQKRQERKKLYIEALKDVVNKFSSPIEVQFNDLLDKLLNKEPNESDCNAFTPDLEKQYINACNLRQELKLIIQKFNPATKSNKTDPKKQFLAAKDKVVKYHVNILKEHKMILQNHQESLVTNETQLLNKKTELLQTENAIKTKTREAIDNIKKIKGKYQALLNNSNSAQMAQSSNFNGPPVPPPPPPAPKHKNKINFSTLNGRGKKSGSTKSKTAALTLETIKNVRLKKTETPKKHITTTQQMNFFENNNSRIINFNNINDTIPKNTRFIKQKSVTLLEERSKLLQSLNTTIPARIVALTNSIDSLNAEIKNISANIVKRRKGLTELEIILASYEKFDKTVHDHLQQAEINENNNVPPNVNIPLPPPPPALNVGIKKSSLSTIKSKTTDKLQVNSSKSQSANNINSKPNTKEKEEQDRVLFDALRRRRQLTANNELVIYNESVIISDDELREKARLETERKKSIIKRYLDPALKKDKSSKKMRINSQPPMQTLQIEKDITDLNNTLKQLNELELSDIAQKLKAPLENDPSELDNNNDLDEVNLNQSNEIASGIENSDKIISLNTLKQDILPPILDELEHDIRDKRFTFYRNTKHKARIGLIIFLANTQATNEMSVDSLLLKADSILKDFPEIKKLKETKSFLQELDVYRKLQKGQDVDANVNANNLHF